MHRHLRRSAWLAGLLALALPVGLAAAQPMETVVQPALDAVFEAFEHRPLVGLGDDHGVGTAMNFYEAVVRDPRFAEEVGTVVVEFGASGRQGVIDRYVAGETVPYTELRTVWTDTVGWTPIPGWLGFAKFFAAVREVNKALPAERRIKVWLGEPPVDWSKPGNQLIGAVNYRDSHPAGIIEREVLAKGRKALVIYGGFHFGGGGWLRGLVEAKHPGAFFVALGGYGVEQMKPGACAPLLGTVAQLWPTPAIVAPAFGTEPDAIMRRCATLDGRSGAGTLTLGPGGAAPAKVMFVEAEGVLFAGPPAARADGPFLPDYLFDADYRREMARRAALGGPGLVRFPPGWTFRKADYAIDLDAPGYSELIAAMFAEHDRNGDGVITREEYQDPIPRRVALRPRTGKADAIPTRSGGQGRSPTWLPTRT